MFSPCKDCPDRDAEHFCWSTCERYLSYRKTYEEGNEKHLMKKKIDFMPFNKAKRRSTNRIQKEGKRYYN